MYTGDIFRKILSNISTAIMKVKIFMNENIFLISYKW